jgi:cytochrome P450
MLEINGEKFTPDEDLVIEGSEFSACDIEQPAVIRNPFPYYDLMRDKPLQFGVRGYPPGTMAGVDEPIPAWGVFRYDDVAHVYANHQIFSSQDRMQEESEAPSMMLVNHDQPEHTFLRVVARQAFSPKRVDQDVAPWLRDIVDHMLEEEGPGKIDFMTNLAADLPARFIARLLGTPADEYKKIRMFADAYMGTSTQTTEEKIATNVELDAYFTHHVNERYKQIEAGTSKDDLMTGFILAKGDDGTQLTPEEVKKFCVTMVAGGAESSVFLIGNQVVSMLEMPELYQRMREDRSLVRPFLEENIRRTGPIQRLFRECTQDTEIRGQEIKKGEWVCVFNGSANHDPSMFENPHEFIMNRPNVGKNLTFGHGIHHCIAALVARNEAAAMINGILDRYKAVEPGDGPILFQDRNFINYGPHTVPVNFIPA